MERPLTAFMVILVVAILLEVAYHFATVGALSGGDSHYPSPHELAREAGLLAPPAAARPVRPAAAQASMASGAPAAPLPPAVGPAPPPRPTRPKARPRPSPPAAARASDPSADGARSSAPGDTDSPPF